MWLFACSFWKVVVCCDYAVICPIKKNRFSTCCLGYAAVHFCQQFIVALQIGVWRQLSTLQQIFSPQQSSRAARRLWLLSTAYFFRGGALRSVLALTHPWPAIFPESLNIRQLLLAPALPTLLLQMSLAATPVRDESQLGPVCLVGE